LERIRSVETKSKLVEKMIREGERDRMDNLMVEEFINGAAPMTEQEQDDAGFSKNVNFLTANKSQSDGAKQLMSIYTKQRDTWRINLRSAPDGKKDMWSKKVTTIFNRTIGESSRFKFVAKSLCNELINLGTAALEYENSLDWCPEFVSTSELLVPRGSDADPESWDYWATFRHLKVCDLKRMHESDIKGFDKKIIAKCIKGIAQRLDENAPRDGKKFSTFIEPPRKLSFSVLDDCAYDTILDQSVVAYTFYQKISGTNRIDKTIILKDVSKRKRDSDRSSCNAEIYFKEDELSSIYECLIPYYLTTNVSGNLKWHNAIGQGVATFPSMWEIEKLRNRLLDKIDSSLMNLWQSEDPNDDETIGRVDLSNNSVIDSHLSLVQTGVSDRLEKVFPVISMLEQIHSGNTGGGFSNQSGVSSSQNVLEVQYKDLVASSREASSNFYSEWAGLNDNLGRQIFRRLTRRLAVKMGGGYIQSGRRGVNEIIEFQEQLALEGIPLEMLQPSNIDIHTARVAGDGNTDSMARIYSHYMSTINQYDPKFRGYILRKLTEIATDDFDEAEYLSPEAPNNEAQISVAYQEDAVAYMGRIPPLNSTDVDEVHIPSHIEGAKILLERLDEEPTVARMTALQALLTHTVQHIQKLMSRSQNNNQGKQWMQEVQAIANSSEKYQEMINEKQAPDEAGPEDADAQIKSREVAVKEGQLQLEAAKAVARERKDEVRQNHREAMDSFNMEIKRFKAETDAFHAQNS